MTAPQTPLRPGGATPAGGGPTPDQAAWIRDHAWTDAMRRGLTSPSGQQCACQKQVTGWACNSNQHDRCDYGSRPAFETTIWRHGGLRPASLPRPMRHKPRTPFGTRTMAMVWLADRMCRSVCFCGCHTAAAMPRQLDLLAEVAAC